MKIEVLLSSSITKSHYDMKEIFDTYENVIFDAIKADGFENGYKKITNTINLVKIGNEFLLQKRAKSTAGSMNYKNSQIKIIVV